MRICDEDGCDRKHYGKGKCLNHYRRMPRTTAPGPGGRPKLATVCSVNDEDCSAPSLHRGLERGLVLGLCGAHYCRLRTHGDTSVVLPANLPDEDGKRWMGDEVGYHGMHKRLSKYRGKASTHTCPCGRQAAEWSYDHSDPDEKQSDQGPYSTDLDAYTPLCIRCHRRRDDNPIATSRGFMR